MSTVHDQNGAQVLPPLGDQRAVTTAWAAHLAIDADQRAKHPEWRALAERLEVRWTP